MSRGRGRTIALAPIVALLVASCGGGSDSSDKPADVAVKTGPTAPATPAPKQGATGATTDNGSSGGSKAPAAKPKPKPKPKAKPKPREKSGVQVLDKEAEKLKKKADKLKKKLIPKDDSSGKKQKPAKKPTPLGSPAQILGAKAKRVCANFGVSQMAIKLNTEATPEAVATAYAKTYPADTQSAVHDGCLAGLGQQQ
jgi:hypothetical protein